MLHRPTGGGKSLVYQVAALMNRGITLFISPLLALASDQMQKLRDKTAKTPHMAYLHLDGMKPSTIKIIADDIWHLTYERPSNRELHRFYDSFCIASFLVGARGQPILDAVLHNQTSALHMVVMDEVHIASQFGNTFRGELRPLKSKFYSKLPACCNIINLFMTGTCTKSILFQVEKLFRFQIPNRHWPTHEETRHRSKYTPLILNEIKSTLSILLKRGTPSAPKKAIIYSNMRQKSRIPQCW